MRKVHAAVFIAAAILMSASLAAADKPGPCLPDPPVNLVCTPGAEGVDFSWDDLAGATKYSLDVEIDDGMEVTEYSFSATESMLSVGFSEFMTCGEARAKVKGLNPPQRGQCSQNNAWSEWCEFEVPCVMEPVP